MKFPNIFEKIWHSLNYDLTISQKGLVLVFVPMGVGIIFIACLAVLLGQAQSDVWRESEARTVVSRVNGIGRHFLNASQSLFRYSLSTNPQVREQFEAEVEQAIGDVETLRELVIDHPWQKENVEQMEHLTDDGLSVFELVVKAADEQDREALLLNGRNYQKTIMTWLDRLSAISRRMIDQEQEQLANSVLSSSKTRELALTWLYIGVVVNIILVFMLALFFSKGITQRLSTLVDNSNRLAGRKALLPPLKGQDEIAIVDQVFHEMAATLADLARKERAVVDNAVDVICSIDANARFLSVNQASLKAWGYQTEELVGQKITNLVVPHDRDRIFTNIRAMIGSTENKFFECRLSRKDKTVVETLWSTTWSAVENAFFCVVHDITQRKEIERLKQEFLQMISHDLRTPLTSIQFSLSIILERSSQRSSEGPSARSSQRSFEEPKEKLPADVIEELEAAERNCDNLITLINRLLDVEKIESGKLDLDLAEMSVANLIRRTKDAIAPFGERHEVAIEWGSADMKIIADEDRLLQVLVNLLSNAVKFSPKGATVKLQVEAQKGRVEFAVIDQGPGIPEDYKEAIFDRFQQVKMSKYVRKGGTGLGLAICRAIVAAHHGEIGVKSAEGEGSTFWFNLPDNSA